LSQPAEMRSHPVVGFHVVSVHSIRDRPLTAATPSHVALHNA
jgi:hypothetical protein